MEDLRDLAVAMDFDAAVLKDCSGNEDKDIRLIDDLTTIVAMASEDE